MTATSATSASASHGGSETPLRAILEVEPDPAAGCPVVAEAPNATGVTQSFAGDGDCHSEVTTVTDGRCERTYVTGSPTDRCVCGVISQYDCVFDVERVDHGSLVISVVVEDRSLLGRIVSGLEDAGATVRLRRLARHAGGETVSVELDATDITTKQREAVELAVELGYYDRPRSASLDDLADRLGVSKSAVSQRLTAVELTLIRSFVDD